MVHYTVDTFPLLLNNSNPEVMSDGSCSSCLYYSKACLILLRKSPDQFETTTLVIILSFFQKHLHISIVDVYDNLNKAMDTDNINSEQCTLLLNHASIILSIINYIG